MLRSGSAAPPGHRSDPRRRLPFDRFLAEEDVARVGVQQLAQARRVGARPLLDRPASTPGRGSFRRGRRAVCRSTDRGGRSGRRRPVASCCRRAGGRVPSPASAGRTVRPGRRPRAEPTALVLVAPGDLGSRVVGDDLVALQATAQAQVLEFGLDGAEVDVSAGRGGRRGRLRDRACRGSANPAAAVRSSRSPGRRCCRPDWSAATAGSGTRRSCAGRRRGRRQCLRLLAGRRQSGHCGRLAKARQDCRKAGKAARRSSSLQAGKSLQRAGCSGLKAGVAGCAGSPAWLSHRARTPGRSGRPGSRLAVPRFSCRRR
jgi:hypothetical protein